MQRVVFNAHYLAYCDDAADLWFRSLGAGLEEGSWDVMVKKAAITWDGAARVHDELAIAVEVSRWGQTSFDVRFTGTVEGAPVFTADLTYVAVTHRHDRPRAGPRRLPRRRRRLTLSPQSGSSSSRRLPNGSDA